MTLEVLENELPPAVLLLGPDPDRMLRAAYRIARKHCPYSADRAILRWLSADTARNLVRFAGTAPFGRLKVVVILLDGSSAQAQNILLKLLEEPPETARFILVSTRRPLPTVVSRCQVITVPAASGHQEADAKATAAVHAALKAATAGDLAGLDAALDGWGDIHHSVLCVALAEAAAGSAAQVAMTRAQARRMLGALGRYDGAHPRLAAHAVLVSVFTAES